MLIENLKESQFSKSVLEGSKHPIKVLTESLDTIPGTHVPLFDPEFSKLCLICNIPIIEFHHIVPLELDGEDIQENIIPLCPTHHRQIHILINLFYKKEFQRITNRIYQETMVRFEYIKRYESKLYQFYWDVTEPAINTRRQEIKKLIKLVKKNELSTVP